MSKYRSVNHEIRKAEKEIAKKLSLVVEMSPQVLFQGVFVDLRHLYWWSNPIEADRIKIKNAVGEVERRIGSVLGEVERRLWMEL